LAFAFPVLLLFVARGVNGCSPSGRGLFGGEQFLHVHVLIALLHMRATLGVFENYAPFGVNLSRFDVIHMYFLK
jgi:hypothetical protein